MTDKYTKSAEGKECQARIPNVCNYDSATTVFAHLNGAGAGLKDSSIHGSYCCSACHDVYDGRVKTSWHRIYIEKYFYEGVFRTQRIMIKQELLKL